MFDKIENFQAYHYPNVIDVDNQAFSQYPISHRYRATISVSQFGCVSKYLIVP
jgi:hypothetical protein